MVQGLNMKTVTVRETLKQTLKASFPGPSAMRKDRSAKSFRPPRPNTWASSYFQLPTPHAQTTQESCLSPFILCLLATLLFMPSPCLTPFLPAVTVSWPLPSGGFREQFQSSGVAQAGGDGDRAFVGCVDPETAVISTWFLDSPSGALAASWQMSALMALIFSPLPPSWGVPAPLHILWQLGL